VSALAVTALVLYALLLAGMAAYGLNELVLVVQHARHRREDRTAPPLPDPLPVVTVQLAVFNEENVVRRLIEAAGQLDWPAERLEIQVLDDSTDGTSVIVAEELAKLQARGLQTAHLQRTIRTEFKAGALQEGMTVAKGDLLALFDADFVPPTDFLRRSVGRFADPRVAAVQGRWTHLNRDATWLTRAQALAIDSHFGVEQEARCRAGWLLNFNGTAGIWRRQAIDDAGGWSGDTLTEDLDLSYRVQLQGWRLEYDAALACPAELPRELSAFKSQQRRWATGSIQTARKLLPAVWRSTLPLTVKVEATLHLTHYSVHMLIAAAAALSIPCVLLPGLLLGAFWPSLLVAGFLLCGACPILLHTYTQRVLEQRVIRPGDLFALSLMGTGIAVSNAVAIVAAFGRVEREFVRTPKLGDAPRAKLRRYVLPGDGLRGFEIALAVYCLAAAAGLAWFGIYGVAAFILLHAAGFGAVAAAGGRAGA
jgi:cellulose synthase/poly-beta-1,6-N-acetylglucosamine synthase-like glycosyltransferase